MLDPWIIEEIRRREEERREDGEQIELPLEQPLWESEPCRPRKDKDKPAERGVVVIDL